MTVAEPSASTWQPPEAAVSHGVIELFNSHLLFQSHDTLPPVIVVAEPLASDTAPTCSVSEVLLVLTFPSTPVTTSILQILQVLVLPVCALSVDMDHHVNIYHCYIPLYHGV